MKDVPKFLQGVVQVVMMRRMIIVFVSVSIPVVALLCAFFLMKNPTGSNAQTKGTMNSIHDITVKDIKGNSFKLDRYKGKVLLIVNVASQCGYTPQYEGLQNVYQKYQSQGLVVLGFPANNFGGQEPGTEEEIMDFCSTNYHVTFPMFSKISATGSDIHPLYKFLTGKETNPQFAGKITWNFNKFLIDKNGKPIARFDSSDKPESGKVTQVIEQALR
jgi:glutathione peroxidase